MEGVFSNGEGGDFLKCGEGGGTPLWTRIGPWEIVQGSVSKEHGKNQ